MTDMFVFIVQSRSNRGLIFNEIFAPFYFAREHENEAGSLPVVKNQILNLLNPIATHHSIPFFISVAVVWKEKMSPIDNNDSVRGSNS